MRVTLFFCLFIQFNALWSQNNQTDDDLIKLSIYFGGGSYFVDEAQSQLIDQFINKVENIETYEVVLFSHTDNIGGKEFNEWLSEMRSRAVLIELTNLGIPEELIEIKDFGLSNPLYKNNSTGGRMMNRRVDIILVPIAF